MRIALTYKGFVTISPKFWRPRRELHPRILLLQRSALLLGYSAEQNFRLIADPRFIKFYKSGQTHYFATAPRYLYLISYSVFNFFSIFILALIFFLNLSQKFFYFTNFYKFFVFYKLNFGYWAHP